MDPAQYFQNLALAAYVDGEIDPSELALLEKHAENLRLSSDQAQDILNRVANGELTEFKKPKSPKARESAFNAVVRILRADRKLTRKEQRMIRILAEKMELGEDTVQEALRQ